MQPTIQAVRSFWERNPLWSGESLYPVGSREYFEEHRRVCCDDGHAGQLDARFFPEGGLQRRILDLGCGPGFWTVEFGLRGCEKIVASDLTERALDLARQRCRLYDVKAEFVQENAEELTFGDETFSHVNCQGVIHHTPDSEACVREIARVLEPRGSACVSVYFRNPLLKFWPVLRMPARLLAKLGCTLRGRGREGILGIKDTGELVRTFDGRDNPIGKCYSRREFVELLQPQFHITDIFFHFFPARALPVRVPRMVRRVLERQFPFMICAVLRKR